MAELYTDQFSEEHDFPVTLPGKVFVIASTERSGSHMLGHALYETGCFGFPLEYVQAGNLAEWRRRLDVQDLQGVISKLQQRRTSSNGVFGIKIHYAHIAQFGGFRGLRSILPEAKFVLLTRHDLLGQAVSLAIAHQTGVWISGMDAAAVTPEYSFKAVDRCMRRIVYENAAWRFLLAANGCETMELSFEQVRGDLPSVIRMLAGFLSVDVPSGAVPQSQVTARQASDINVEWREKYLRDYSGAEWCGNGKYDSLSRRLNRLRRASFMGL